MDGELGLGSADATVVPTPQAGVAPSDQTVVFASVPADRGPTRGDTSSSQPVAAQPVPTATQPSPLAAQPSPTAAQPNPLAAQPSPKAAQPSPHAAQPSPVAASAGPTPAAWSSETGADPAGPWPAAPQPTPQHHQGQYPPQGQGQYPTQDQYPTQGQGQYPTQDQYPTPALYPGQQYHPVPDPYRPAYADEGGSAGRSRATLIGAVVAAGVAVVAVAGLGAVVLTRDDPPPSGTAPAAAGPTAAGPPPGDVKLRDDSTTITLTWTDPSGGAVPFMVAAGRAGQPLGVMATVDPGKTSYTVNGLNSRVDHCFTVLAVYSTDSFATSGQVCTARERTTPSSGKPSAGATPR
ncbi:hypothetical protein JOD64_000841 [Micromonospora luteifusca]|uniref:Fibronectin type-III domain-containing protein n=1 Tax=Micromonospora luteifusca TaxID=709860 RepID=A0ABS2LPP5_9ACTN|nr:hypothetical protein [Micromonospora luteifusca]MBM7489619.1 hypothetical protein [Micromonospora luteifusca]